MSRPGNRCFLTQSKHKALLHQHDHLLWFTQGARSGSHGLADARRAPHAAPPCHSAKSHLNFIEKHNLPFPLIADTEKEIQQLYGVWGEKKFMGKTHMGTIRTTYIIDANGIIEDVITKVNTKAHTAQILK